MASVLLQRQYVPGLVYTKPSFGITGNEGEFIVSLDHSIPEDVDPFLLSHLRGLLATNVACAHFLWVATHDFFSMQILSGNLRLDSSTRTWYWFGSSFQPESPMSDTVSPEPLPPTPVKPEWVVPSNLIDALSFLENYYNSKAPNLNDSKKSEA